MAFDVYVGTMTRFYRREWENVVQRASRLRGEQYKMIHAGGQPPAPPPAEEIREGVGHWCRWLDGCLGLGAAHVAPIRWDEDDKKPYFTDRPGWRGYCGTLLWAAYADHPEMPPPTALPETWADDPAFQRSVAPGGKTLCRAILEPELWLPVELPGVFRAPTLMSENETCIGSTFALRDQLSQLAARTGDRLQQRTNPPEDDSLCAWADFGLGMFIALATHACDHRLPMMLHY